MQDEKQMRAALCANHQQDYFTAAETSKREIDPYFW